MRNHNNLDQTLDEVTLVCELLMMDNGWLVPDRSASLVACTEGRPAVNANGCWSHLCGTLGSVTSTVLPPRLPELADVPHAIPYQGSKRQLAHAIVPLLPGDTARLLEPFAGSAAVSIAARHLRIGQRAELSDINEPLMVLWQVILDEPQTLAAEYERLWTEQLDDPRAFYDEVRSKFNATHEPHHLLYLLARCVKAAVRYNRDGDFNQGADNRRLGAKPATIRSRLLETSRTLTGSNAGPADYAAVLAGADTADVVYMDPPYQGVTNTRDHRYMVGLPRDAFVSVLQKAVDQGTSFILSYDGMTGDRKYGEALPPELGLLHLHVYAGKSSQATLNGMSAETVESLYLSPAIVHRLGGTDTVWSKLVMSPTTKEGCLF